MSNNNNTTATNNATNDGVEKTTLTTTTVSTSCCKNCRASLNGASIIPCVGNLICSKCLNASQDLEGENDRKTVKSESLLNKSSTSIVESQTNRVIEAINRAAEEKIREIERVREKLINQIKMDRSELLLAGGIQRKNETNSLYEMLACQHYNNNNAAATAAADDGNKSSVSTLARAIHKVNMDGVGIRFSPAKETFKVSELGDIEYDDVLYRIDVRSKLELLNNDFQYKVINLSRFIQPVTMSKHVQLLAPDKVLLIHVKVHGRVLITYLKVIYADGSVMYETEHQNVDSFYRTHAVYSNKYIILAYDEPNRGVQLSSYDFRLNQVERQSQLEDLQAGTLDVILPSETRMYLVRDTDRPSAHLIHEFDYQFKRMGSPFGQNKWPKKPFYIPPGTDVFAVENERIYIKTESRIRIVSKANGQLLSDLLIDDLHLSRVYLDMSGDEELFVLFNGYTRVSLFDSRGDLVATNKIRVSEKFDQFQYIRAGYFAFFNSEKMIMLII